MLSGVQQRAARAISHLYGHQQEADLINDKPVNPVAAAAAPAIAFNNILPFSPFLRRLLEHATAPALGGVRQLHSALLRRGALRPAKRDGTTTAGAASGPATLAPPPLVALAQDPLPEPFARQPLGTGCGSPLPAGRTGSQSALGSGCVLLQRALEEFKAFRFPRQTNRMVRRQRRVFLQCCGARYCGAPPSWPFTNM
jgi:hypothetical protein